MKILIENKATFTDRFGYSFNIFKNKFKDIILPIFIFNFIFTTIYSLVFSLFFRTRISSLIKNLFLIFINFLENNSETSKQVDYTAIKETFIYFAGINILGILSSILFIGIIIGIIKIIFQTEEGEKNSTLKNIKYGFLNIGNAFKTYWYIFSYIYLLPAIIFIFGGLLLSLGLFLEISSIVIFGYFFIAISVIFLLYNTIYKGIKSILAIYSAVDSDDYSKNNFTNYLKLTENNYSRILFNFIGLIIAVNLVIGFLNSSILSLITFEKKVDLINVSQELNINNFFKKDSIKLDYGKIKNSILKEINSPEGKKNIEIFTKGLTKYDFSNIVRDLISSLIKSLGPSFIIIFMYLFFKRLEFEYKNKSSANLKNKTEI